MNSKNDGIVEVPIQFRKPRDTVAYLAGYEQGFDRGVHEGYCKAFGLEIERPKVPTQPWRDRCSAFVARNWPILVQIAILAVLVVLMFSLTGCASEQRHNFYTGEDSRRPETASTSEAIPTAAPAGGCKDGHCWRVIDTGEFMGRDGYLLPPPRDAEQR